MHIAVEYGQVDGLLVLNELGAAPNLINKEYENVKDFVVHYKMEIPHNMYKQIFGEDTTAISLETDISGHDSTISDVI